MLTCRRPLGWNHLAEVVHSDPRLGVYIGDMPHTWVGSGYISAVRNMFAYEHRGELVLAAGIDAKWAGEGGVTVETLPTQFGPISVPGATTLEHPICVKSPITTPIFTRPRSSMGCMSYWVMMASSPPVPCPAPLVGVVQTGTYS